MPFYHEDKEINDRVRDHFHITGSYRGAAHTHCNLNVKQGCSSYILIALHNMTKNDLHSLIKVLINQKNLNVNFKFFPQTVENNISNIYGRLRIFDSINFMKKILDTTAEKMDLDDFLHTTKYLERNGSSSLKNLIILLSS